MPTTQVRIPKLCKHKATGQAVVRLDGKDHYLGKFGTAAATAAYERLIAEWLAHGRRLPDSRSGPMVNELILGYWRRCQEHYRKADGSPSSELDLVRLALRPLKQLYGRTPGAKFGPLALKAVRQRMIDAGLSRGVINAHVTASNVSLSGRSRTSWCRRQPTTDCRRSRGSSAGGVALATPRRSNRSPKR